jgi:hypothetical protein
LYGPGDIVGFDPRAVERTDPQPDIGDFEWNYFPAIEFVDADFAWRFTGNVASAQGRLTPWITLIVLVAETQGREVTSEFTALPPSGRAPGQISIPNCSVLPDLQHAWRWAHVHIEGKPGLTRDDLLALLRDEPERATCRLLCPRRLRAGTRYAAFVVPTFKLGVLAGLGASLDPTIKALIPAWSSTDAAVTIPYYYRWEFRTSASGDFEQLVRRLEPRPLPNIGLRDVECATPGFGIPGVSRGTNVSTLGLEGALRSIDTVFTSWGRDPATAPPAPVPPTQQKLALLLNQPDTSLLATQIGFAVTASADVTLPSGRGLSSGTAVELRWRTAAASTSEVLATAPDGSTRAVRDGTATTDHQLAVTGLVPGQIYTVTLGGRAPGGISLAPATGTLSIPVPSVVPPIYGRWHFGGGSNVRPDTQESWFHVLNLDPRHRLAAGLGAEVVRRQQDGLMASAWDQLGTADEANSLLRRAQFGRQTATRLFERLRQLPLEDLLYVTRRAQERILVTDSVTGRRITVARSVSERSRIPAAVLDPAFRHITRRRGPIRTRQSRPRSTDLLRRLATGALEAAGPAPVPLGTARICDVSTRLRDTLVPTVSLTATPTTIADGGSVSLRWSSTHATSRVAAGSWSGTKAAGGTVTVGPFARPTGGGTTTPETSPTNPTVPVPDLPITPLPTLQFRLQCDGPGGSVVASVLVNFEAPGLPGGGSITASGTLVRAPRWDASSKRFCDGALEAQQLNTSLASNPFQIAIATGYTLGPSATRVLGALEALDREPPADGRPPRRDPSFVADIRNAILPALEPVKTIVARTKARLKLSGTLARRFDSGVTGDPLDPLLFEPTFPQPMYEPLRDLAHQLLLPGIETIPQDTVSLLETNRRFIESYMCGLNHEFAGELLWRQYPTDQRGSYFRQFWDVSEYVSSDAERLQLLTQWCAAQGVQTVAALPRDHRITLLRRDLLSATESVFKELNVTDQPILDRLMDPSDTLSDVSDSAINAIVQAAAIQDRLDERLRDIARLTDWKASRLGSNTRPAPANVADPLVFVVRGELLRRYPGALVYAVDAVKGPTGQRRPGLEEYLREFVGDISSTLQPRLESRLASPALTRALSAIGIHITSALITAVVPGLQWLIEARGARYDVLKASNALRVYRSVASRRPHFPIFKASLPPDIVFYGFPFTVAEARTANAGLGKYFIIEERPGEPRFGLDTSGPDQMRTWDDLSWKHFGLHIDDGVGKYLDGAPVADPAPAPVDADDRSWEGDSTSSATRAWITLQRPSRIAVHATQMLP